MTNGEWYIAQSLPETMCCASGTTVNGYVYLLGGWTKRDQSSPAVFRSSVDALFKTSQPAATFQPNAADVWDTLPNLPVLQATCTSFRNHLMVVGGKANMVAAHEIRSYNEGRKRWDVIGYLPNPRYLCFVVGFPNKLIVIGGRIDSATHQNNVDIYTVTKL